MKNRFKNEFVTAFFILVAILLVDSARAAETPKQTCGVLYLNAAQALDQRRSTCGLNPAEDTLFCKLAGKTDTEIHINVAGAYRALNDLGVLPNKFRRVSKLIVQAYDGKGALLNRQVRRIRKVVPGLDEKKLAQLIVNLDQNGGLCEGNVLTSIRGVRKLLTSKLNVVSVAQVEGSGGGD